MVAACWRQMVDQLKWSSQLPVWHCIQRVGLIRAIRPGGDASVGQSGSISVIMLSLGSNGMGCSFSTWRGGWL